MIEPEDSTLQRTQIRLILGGAVLALAVQFGLTQQILAPATGYTLYWRPFRDLMVLLAAVLPLVSLVAIIGGFALSRKSANANSTALSVGLAVLWFILLLPSCRASVSLALGGDRGQTVATANVAGRVYRLDFITAGDPPHNYFGFYECELFGWLCKTLGMVYPNEYLQTAPDVALIPKREQLEINIAGIVVGMYANGQLVCVSTDQFSCQPQ